MPRQGLSLFRPVRRLAAVADEPKGKLPMLGAASLEVDSNQDHGHDDDRPRHRDRGSAFPSRTPSSGLADRNAERAAACLERILAGEPLPHLPDLPPDLAAALPEAIGEAQRDLAPGDPGEVLAALTTLASRRGFDLPDGLALELDIEVMANWPRDLWRGAFRGIWEHFPTGVCPRSRISGASSRRTSPNERADSIASRQSGSSWKPSSSRGRGTKRRGQDGDPALDARSARPSGAKASGSTAVCVKSGSLWSVMLPGNAGARVCIGVEE